MPRALRLLEPRNESPITVDAYGASVYAIAFDMDTDSMRKLYGKPSWESGYGEIRDVLVRHGFSKQQGSVYFGDRGRVKAVSCVVAVQDLARELPWFSASVRDIRMLRIEEEDDLGVALEKVEPPPATGRLFDASS
jgi:virulence-associated protein VapD